MSDTTEPRDPRIIDPSTPTTVECVMPDIYGWPVLCDQVEPCSGDGITTLWGVMECGPHNPTLAEFCSVYAGHPSCPAPSTTTTITVEVGMPPTLPLPPANTLPATGGGGLVLVAGTFVVLGALAVMAARYGRRMRGAYEDLVNKS